MLLNMKIKTAKGITNIQTVAKLSLICAKNLFFRVIRYELCLIKDLS